jgi:aminomethyltransferase
MSLYGHEINDSITPYEANLAWIVKLNKGDFIGRDALVEQKEQGVARRLAGLEMRDRGIARDGYRVFSGGRDIGWVTSGSPSPLLQKNIGLCMLPVAEAEIGRRIDIEIRQRLVPAEIVPIPFYSREKKS